MGVPNQTELDLTYSLGEPSGGGSSGSNSGNASNSAGNRFKPPPSPPDSAGNRVKPPPSPPANPNLPKPPTLNTATFAAKETAKFDCGSTVEMWYMCRLFSPRRRQRRRSSSDSRSQQQQQQEQKEEEEEEEGAAEDPAPQPRQAGRGLPKESSGSRGVTAAARDGGVTIQGGMDVSDDDEAQECDGLMLDSETEGGRENNGGDGDGDDDGDVDHCGSAGAAEDKGAGVRSSSSSPHGDHDGAAKVAADGE